jgi:hypothetical protein
MSLDKQVIWMTKYQTKRSIFTTNSKKACVQMGVLLLLRRVILNLQRTWCYLRWNIMRGWLHFCEIEKTEGGWNCDLFQGTKKEFYWRDKLEASKASVIFVAILVAYLRNTVLKFNVHGSVYRNNILIYIQQDATLHSLCYLETALHVSGGTTIHYQKRKQLYLQHLVFVTPLLLPAAIGR